MIYYDGIIEKLQSMGGITVLFKELLSRSDSHNFKYYSYDESSKIIDSSQILISRFQERYREFNLDIKRNDIFHSTYYRIPEKKCNVVTTVHDFTYEKFVTGLPKLVHSWQKKRAVLNSDHIICVSKNTANDLQEFYKIPDHKISVVYNGVSNDYYPLNILDSNSNILLYIGARGGYKNFTLVVDALVNLKSFVLNIVGSPLDEQEIKFLNEKIKNRYNFLGRLTNAELNIQYNNSYALIYPSSYEGFGIPALEAMKAGCPVIAMNSSSLPEVIGDAGILLNQISVDELVDAINQIYSMRKELVTRGLQQAKLFSWDKCYTDTLEVYNKF